MLQYDDYDHKKTTKIRKDVKEKRTKNKHLLNNASLNSQLNKIAPYIILV